METLARAFFRLRSPLEIESLLLLRQGCDKVTVVSNGFPEIKGLQELGFVGFSQSCELVNLPWVNFCITDVMVVGSGNEPALLPRRDRSRPFKFTLYFLESDSRG